MTMLQRISDAWASAWGQGETAAFEAILAPGYRRHSKTGEEALADVLREIQAYHAAFSGYRVALLHVAEASELIAIHWQSTGTHTGTFMGVPPTHRTVTVDGASFLSHRDGLITEESVVWDPRELLSAMNIWHLGDQVSTSA